MSSIEIYVLEFTQIAVSQKSIHAKNILSKEEFNRASKNLNFLKSRYTLRNLLSQHTKTPPKTLSIDYNPDGKPYLRHHPKLHFNISHSHNYLIIAIAKENPVGIDIEYHKPLKSLKNIAARFFSDQEIMALKNNTQELDLFFTLWTKKEALAKAIGHSIFTTVKTNIYQKDSITYKNITWYLQTLPINPNYTFSIASTLKTPNIILRSGPQVYDSLRQKK